MTNITYFHNAIREYYSSSSASSSSNEHQAPPHHGGAAAESKAEAASSSSLYTAIGKAYLPCVRPAIELEQQQEDDNDDSSTTPQPISGSSFRRFDFHQLKTATRHFEATAALKGSHRSMFEAWVDGHKLTATKPGRGCIAVCVKVFNQQPSQDHTEFLGRVDCLAHIAHPNLVRLVGYGLEDTRRLLVYEFTSRGSLEDHLFEKSSQNFIWGLRMKVALDAAKGLAFLHSSGKENIHGFLNPYNILVDSNYNAKLSGFGLIKDRPTTFPEEVLDSFLREDLPYSINSATIHDAPEYRYTGQFSAKSDVFSFGVVFLEMLCGRRAFEDSLPSEEQNLLEWTKSHSSLMHVLDSRTMGQYSRIQKAITLVDKCLSVQVTLRPTMDEVVQALEELQN